MVAVPPPTPVTTPELLTVATDGLPLVHTPPVVPSARLVVALWHNMSVPVIGSIEPEDAVI